MSRNKWMILALCALPVLAGCGGGAKEEASSEAPAAEAPAAAVDTANAGGVNGSVTYAGADTDTPIAMNADPVCASLHQTPVDTNEIALKDGKLGNVFVYVKSGLEGKSFPAPAEKKEIDQVGCQYTPRVLGVQVGQPVTIKNTDATLHNVHALCVDNPQVNFGMTGAGQSRDLTFAAPERFAVKCDVHPWMRAHVYVFDHPFFAATGGNGRFEITGLPPGEHTLVFSHPFLGDREQKIVARDSEPAEADVVFEKGK